MGARRRDVRFTGPSTRAAAAVTCSDGDEAKACADEVVLFKPADGRRRPGAQPVVARALCQVREALGVDLDLNADLLCDGGPEVDCLVGRLD